MKQNKTHSHSWRYEHQKYQNVNNLSYSTKTIDGGDEEAIRLGDSIVNPQGSIH